MAGVVSPRRAVDTKMLATRLRAIWTLVAVDKRFNVMVSLALVVA
jgi:hypothetical protein